MNSTGIVKDIDSLGRFVIPNSIRKKLDLKTLEIFIDGENLVLKRVDVDYCICCEEKNDLIKFNDKLICKNCIGKIKEL